MKHIFFKKETTLGFKLESLYWRLWKQSFFRFLVVGGLNTALGYLFTLGLRFGFFSEAPKFFIFGLEIDIANTINFIVLLPLAYTLQTLFVFQSPWSWKRLSVYPLSTIPNYLLNQGFILLFETIVGITPFISYALAAMFPIPIMFIVIRLLVKGQPTLKA
jgi:putative flippase GtrA